MPKTVKTGTKIRLQMKSDKKIPRRRCVGCGNSFDQSTLCRIRKISKDEYVIDKDNSMTGRSAYVCKNDECIKLARKKRGFDRAFRTSVPISVYDLVEEDLLS